MGLTSQPTRADSSIGRVKSNDQPVEDLDTQVPAAEWEKIKSFLIDVCDEVGNHVGTAGDLNARVDAIETAGFGVSSVFGRTGAVVAQSGDYAASLISNDSGVAGVNVDDALDNLDSGKSGSLQEAHQIGNTISNAALGLDISVPDIVLHAPQAGSDTAGLSHTWQAQQGGDGGTSGDPGADGGDLVLLGGEGGSPNGEASFGTRGDLIADVGANGSGGAVRIGTTNANAIDIGRGAGTLTIATASLVYADDSSAWTIDGATPSTVGADGRDVVWTGAPGADGDGATAGGAGGPITHRAGAGGADGGAGAGVGGAFSIFGGDSPGSAAAGDVFIRGGQAGDPTAATGNVRIGTIAAVGETGTISNEGNLLLFTGPEPTLVAAGWIVAASQAGVNLFADNDNPIDLDATGEIQLSSTTAGIVRIEDADLRFGTADGERIARNNDSFEFYTNSILTMELRRQVDSSVENVGMALTPKVNLSGTTFYDGQRTDVIETAVGDGTDDPDGIGNTVHRWRVDDGGGSGLVTVAAITSSGRVFGKADGSVGTVGQTGVEPGLSLLQSDGTPTGSGLDLHGDNPSRMSLVSDGKVMLAFFANADGGNGAAQVHGQFKTNSSGTTSRTAFSVGDKNNIGLYEPSADVLGLVAGGVDALNAQSDPGTPADGDTNIAIREHQDTDGGGTITAALATVELGGADGSVPSGYRPLVVPDRTPAA